VFSWSRGSNVLALFLFVPEALLLRTETDTPPPMQQFTMPTSGQFPNESYLDGLRNDPESSVAVVYNEFRGPILRAFADLEVADKDAILFFQMAVTDAARMARTGEVPVSLPFPIFLHTLSVAHCYASKGIQELPEAAPAGCNEEAWRQMPEPTTLRETQAKTAGWAIVPDLDPECHSALLNEPKESDDDETSSRENQNTCKEQVLRAIQAPASSELPAWLLPALRDTDGCAAWQRTQELEQGRHTEQAPVPQESNRIWRWVVLVFLITVVGYSAFQFFFRPKTAAEVFADNFAPPGSLIADMEARYGAEMGNDSVSARPNTCLMLLSEADAYYQASNYESALEPLLLIVTDSSAICQSDAWYFLGIIQLQLEEPASAVQCFAKIEDIERYGEDLYWYQALAFVQMAKGNPLLRDRAIRAVEQAIGNIQNPKRRSKAEEMLTNLSR